jgi:hypothetical protein
MSRFGVLKALTAKCVLGYPVIPHTYILVCYVIPTIHKYAFPEEGGSTLLQNEFRPTFLSKYTASYPRIPQSSNVRFVLIVIL